MAWAERLWEMLEVAPGVAALSLIISLAFAMVALTLFYLGSAVLVLERFARVVRSPWRALAFAACWSLPTAAVAARWWPESGPLATGPSPLALLWPWPPVLIVCLALGLSAWAGVRLLSSAALGRLGLVWLGLGAALVSGASADLRTALAPALSVLGAILVSGIAIWAVSPAGITQLEQWIGSDATAVGALSSISFVSLDVAGDVTPAFWPAADEVGGAVRDDPPLPPR